MRFIYIVIAICFFSTSVYSEIKEVDGIILNAQTNSPVEFANIGIEGTYLGAASDFEGKFVIELSPDLSENIIRISAVGYTPKTIKVSEWMGADDLKVFLSPVNYGLSEVDIMAESKIAYGIIRTAANLIIENYPQSSFGMQYTYNANEGVFDNKSVNRAVSIYDESAYTDRSYTDAYKNRNYKFADSTEEDRNTTLKEGMTWMEHLLSGDVARVMGNVLSINTIEDFDIEIKDETILNNDSVWVIDYVCVNPTIANTGCADVLEYKGTITISHDNYAIINNKVLVKRISSTIHGNSFNSVSKEDAIATEYQIQTNYKKEGQYYFLNEVVYSQGEKEASITAKKQISFNPSVKTRQFYLGKKY